eukprot:829235-Amphidinium_carterae.1
MDTDSQVAHVAKGGSFRVGIIAKAIGVQVAPFDIGEDFLEGIIANTAAKDSHVAHIDAWG